MSLDEAPTLFLEFQGSKSSNDQHAEIAMDICKENSCKEFKWSSELEERNKLWTARHNTWFAFKAVNPNRKAISTDACVPISALPELLLKTKKDIEELKLNTIIVGHVGDGNFHTFLSLDVNDEEEIGRYHEYNKRLIRHALQLNGTCTGEHGIGLGLISNLFVFFFLKLCNNFLVSLSSQGKKKYLVEQFGENGVDLMKTIKSSIDPNNIMNPHKIFL